MNPSGSFASGAGSTETLFRGAQILNNIAGHGVIKHELPEDEAEIQKQIQAPEYT